MSQQITIPNTSFSLGYGASKSQDLGITPKQLQVKLDNPNYFNEGFYTLSFSVTNQLGNYPGYYTARLSFGIQELCEASGWGTSAPVQVSIISPGSVYIVIDNSLPDGGPAQGNNNLILTFTVNDGSANGGWPLDFKNVSLTFTPVN